MNFPTFGEAMILWLGGVAAIITIVAAIRHFMKDWRLIHNFVARTFHKLWTVIKDALWLIWIPGRIQQLEAQRDIFEQQ